MNYHIGDLYYYAAYVHKLLSDGLPFYSPSAAELAGKPLVETWRFMPILLAAVPGLVFYDMRFVILAGYGLSAALVFGIPFFLANRLTENRWVAMGVGLASLFGTDRLWTILPTHPDSLRALGSWLHLLWSTGWVGIWSATIFSEYDFYGNTFRYVNLSFSVPILLAFFTIAVMVHIAGSWPWILAMAVLAPAMAFSYPSHAFIAYTLLIGFAGLNLLRRDWFRFAAFAGVGAATLIFLLAIDYPGMVSRILNNSELWTNIFAQDKLTLRSYDADFLVAVVINKYLLTFAIMLVMTRSERILRDVVLVVGLIGWLLSLSHLFDMPQLWGRFLGRGIDHVWTITFAICLGTLLAKWSPALETLVRFKQMRRWNWNTLALGLSVMLLTGLLVVPLWGFGRLGMIHLHDESRFLPQAKMDAYRWIAANIPAGTPIAVLDWEDISILPIYSKAALVVGHNVIDGRSPREELERFVNTHKFLGRSREDLVALVTAGPKAVLAADRSGGSRPPFLDAATFESYQFMNGILYWPYIKLIEDMPIATKDIEPVITPQFMQVLLKIYDDADPATFLQRYSVGAVVVNANDPFIHGPGFALREVFRNSSHVVYSR